MRLMRLLALGGLGYSAYQWLRRRPQTKLKLEHAITDIREAARHGDIAKAREVVTDVRETLMGKKSA